MTQIAYGRTFLNPEQGLAAASFYISRWDDNHIDAELTIKDCHHTIDLEFAFSTEDERDVALAKATRLRLFLAEFMDELRGVELKVEES